MTNRNGSATCDSFVLTLELEFERAVHKQLHHCPQLYKILSANQYGFRNNNSTEFETLLFAETIRRNINQGRFIGTVFIDCLRKASDTVRHDLLVDQGSLCWTNYQIWVSLIESSSGLMHLVRPRVGDMTNFHSTWVGIWQDGRNEKNIARSLERV